MFILKIEYPLCVFTEKELNTTSITVSTAHSDIPPLPTSVQPISITKTLLIVPTKNERDPPLLLSQ